MGLEDQWKRVRIATLAGLAAISVAKAEMPANAGLPTQAGMREATRQVLPKEKPTPANVEAGDIPKDGIKNQITYRIKEDRDVPLE